MYRTSCGARGAGCTSSRVMVSTFWLFMVVCDSSYIGQAYLILILHMIRPPHDFYPGGEGCDAITCVCLATFSWRALLQQRDLREVEAFSGLYPEDPPRAAVKILRRGPPRSLDDEAKRSKVTLLSGESHAHVSRTSAFY